MNSRKGFTLIELLAVIVILAIIALIATPTILGVIDKARKGSAESSALGYIDAVEKQIMIDMVETTSSERLILTSEDGTIPATVTLPVSSLNVKGEAPTAGTLKLDSNGSVTSGSCMVISASGVSYKVTYDGKKATAVKGTSCTE